LGFTKCRKFQSAKWQRFEIKIKPFLLLGLMTMKYASVVLRNCYPTVWLSFTPYRDRSFQLNYGKKM
jgi:hypothetical protein